jgi:hypothetical protein
MTGPPSYPDTGGTSQAAGPSPPVRPRWRTAAIVVLVIAALAVMVILHLSGTFGEGTHG